MNNFDNIMLLLLASISVASFLSWISISIGPKVGLMDIPGTADHKKHIKPIPSTGGVVLLLTMLIMMLLIGNWDKPEMSAITLSSTFICIFGLLDDFINLSPIYKLTGQLIGAMLLINLGVQVNIFGSPDFIYRTDSFLDEWLNYIFTLLWLVTLTNAFNFIDSSDGLSVGLGGFSTAFFLIISLMNGQTSLTYFCSILLGVCIGLYFFNAYPARLFLGDSGAQTLGFLLSAIAIIYNPGTGSQSSTWFVPILIFYVPLFDLGLVVLSRIKRGVNIYIASQDHTYHRLFDRGVPIQHSVLVLHGASFIMSIVGYLCLNLSVMYSNIVFLLTILLGAVFFFELDKNYKP